MCEMKLTGSEPNFDYRGWGDKGRNHDNCYDYAFNSYSIRRPIKSVPGSNGNFPEDNFTDCTNFVKRVISDNKKTVYSLKYPCTTCQKGYYKVMGFVAPTNNYNDPTGDFHWYRQNQSVRYRICRGDTVYGLSKFFRVKPAVILSALRKRIKPTSRDDGFIADRGMEINIPEPTVSMIKRYELYCKKLTPGWIIKFPVNAWSHKQGWATGPLMVDASGNLILDPRKANRHYGYNYSKFCSAFCVKKRGVKT
jgi:hypothetical protein